VRLFNRAKRQEPAAEPRRHTVRRVILGLLGLWLIVMVLKAFLPDPKPALAPIPTSTVSMPTTTAPAQLVSAPTARADGPCRNPDDRARDGSRCGNRAASVRPGGK
jgi:hypothetical protein